MVIKFRYFEKNFIFLALILVTLFFSAITDNFFSKITLFTILNQLPALMTISIGMTLVLIISGIDLSVGSIQGLSSAIVGSSMMLLELNLASACMLGILAGLICGIINGSLTAKLALPSFIVTLGMLEVARGFSYLATNSQTIYIGSTIQWIASPLPHINLSPSLIFSIILVVISHFVLTQTIFGRYLIAIGTNEKAALMSGINAKPLKIIVFSLSGLLAGIAGIFNTAYLGAADPNAGFGLELAAIAAAVIGGTSLMGGRGSIIGTFAGVLIIAVLQNGLAQAGATETTKKIITGLVIILAVIIDRWRSRS